MRVHLLLAVLLWLLLLGGIPARASASASRPITSTAASILASADAYVDSSLPGRNFGSAPTAWVRGGDPARRTLLRFDLASIPSGVRITSAVLKLHVSGYGSSTAGHVSSVSGAWGEKTVTFATAPAPGAWIASIPGQALPYTTVSANVTAFVVGKSAVSLYLLSADSDGAAYYTRDKGPVVAPRLLVTWTTSADPTVMAAGDIICTNLTTNSAGCQQMAVSQLVVDQKPSAALILGDLCHRATAACFSNYYVPSWGRVFAISRPVPGNHEYLAPGAAPYFDYWNGAGNTQGRAGDRKKGYYSFDIGTWHVVALNSECSDVGGCAPGSPQYTWLKNDLDSHRNFCTLAIYHIPVYSSGGRASSNMRKIFALLYADRAELVLNGHDHIYERFAPQDAAGALDRARGIREFVVGTGGANHTYIASAQRNSEVRNTTTFGVLKLTLHPGSYDWRFVPVAGKTFTDSGSAPCH